MAKHLTSSLQGEWVCCGSQLEGLQSVMQGKAWQLEQENQSHCTHSQSQEAENEPEVGKALKYQGWPLGTQSLQ